MKYVIRENRFDDIVISYLKKQLGGYDSNKFYKDGKLVAIISTDGDLFVDKSLYITAKNLFNLKFESVHKLNLLFKKVVKDMSGRDYILGIYPIQIP